MSFALKAGRLTELGFMLVVTVATIYYLWAALKGRPQKLRVLPGVAAISDGVDKAVEEGKPVFVSPGNMAYLSGLYAPMTIAGMNILRYTARMCIRKGARIILPVPYNPEAMPLIDGIFREVAVSEGKPEAYRREDVRYYGSTEHSFAIGCDRDIAVESCSLIVAVGANSTAEKGTMGTAYLEGALVIGGTPRWQHQATNAVESDYPLFCEDVYAAGAQVADDPVAASGQVGADIFKLFMMVGLLVTMILAAAGLSIVGKGGWLYA